MESSISVGSLIFYGGMIFLCVMLWKTFMSYIKMRLIMAEFHRTAQITGALAQAVLEMSLKNTQSMRVLFDAMPLAPDEKRAADEAINTTTSALGLGLAELSSLVASGRLIVDGRGKITIPPPVVTFPKGETES